MGFRIEEIKGQHHSMFVDPAYAASSEYRQFWSRLQQLAASRRGVSGAWEKVVSKSGSKVRLSQILDIAGRPFKVVKYATNITQLKSVEASLESTVQSLGQRAQELDIC